MTVLHEILVPMESVNDDYLTVVSVCFENGDVVKRGDVLLELESSKAIKTIEAAADGYVRYYCQEGDEVDTNKLIAQVVDEQPAVSVDMPANANAATGSLSFTNKAFDTQFSTKAIKLMDEHGLSKQAFASRDFVNEQAVLDHLSSTSAPRAYALRDEKLPANVTLSKVAPAKKREIEYLSAVQDGGLVSTIYIDVDANGISQSVNNEMAWFKDSLLPLTTYECSRLLLKYAPLNAFYVNGSIATYNDVQIGIAIDIDDGLKVVRVPDTQTRSLSEIEKSIFDLSNKYLDKQLTAADLTGATFTITDLSAQALIFTPLVNKGNSAILGIGKTDRILNRAILSLSFDHRVTEGKVAGNFLSELKERLESYSQGRKDTARLSCYKCMKNISEDVNDVGFIKVITSNGEEKLICDMCLLKF